MRYLKAMKRVPPSSINDMPSTPKAMGKSASSGGTMSEEMPWYTVTLNTTNIAHRDEPTDQ